MIYIHSKLICIDLFKLYALIYEFCDVLVAIRQKFGCVWCRWLEVFLFSLGQEKSGLLTPEIAIYPQYGYACSIIKKQALKRSDSQCAFMNGKRLETLIIYESNKSPKLRFEISSSAADEWVLGFFSAWPLRPFIWRCFFIFYLFQSLLKGVIYRVFEYIWIKYKRYG